MTTDNIMSDTTKDAVPVAWFYYEDGEFIRMYDSEDRAEAAREKFGGDVEPVYKHPAQVQAEVVQVIADIKAILMDHRIDHLAIRLNDAMKRIDAYENRSTGDQS